MYSQKQFYLIEGNYEYTLLLHLFRLHRRDFKPAFHNIINPLTIINSEKHGKHVYILWLFSPCYNVSSSQRQQHSLNTFLFWFFQWRFNATTYLAAKTLDNFCSQKGLLDKRRHYNRSEKKIQNDSINKEKKYTFGTFIFSESASNHANSAA